MRGYNTTASVLKWGDVGGRAMALARRYVDATTLGGNWVSRFVDVGDAATVHELDPAVGLESRAVPLGGSACRRVGTANGESSFECLFGPSRSNAMKNRKCFVSPTCAWFGWSLEFSPGAADPRRGVGAIGGFIRRSVDLRFVVLLNSRLNTCWCSVMSSGSLRVDSLPAACPLPGRVFLNAADIAVEPNELRWRQRVFDFERVTARSVAIDWIPSSEPAAAPASLASPIDLRVRNLNVGELRFGARGKTPSVVGTIVASLRYNADEILVEHSAFQHGPQGRVTLNGRIAARSPFACVPRHK